MLVINLGVELDQVFTRDAHGRVGEPHARSVLVPILAAKYHQIIFALFLGRNFHLGELLVRGAFFLRREIPSLRHARLERPAPPRRVAHAKILFLGSRVLGVLPRIR
jgi:hypothetical protein